MWPADASAAFARTGLIDLIGFTSEARAPLPGCSGCDLGADCGHLWTHRNRGGKNPRAQQIDFVFASEALARELRALTGGYDDYPDADEASDHAPVVADFR